MLVTNNNCCLTISLLLCPKSKFNCTKAIKSDHFSTNLADGTIKTVTIHTKNNDVKQINNHMKIGSRENL